MGHDVIASVYNDPQHPAGFSTVNKLKKATGIPIKTIREWLESQETYTRHKPSRKKFIRNRYEVNYIDECWQCDLNDLRSLKKYNNGFCYIMTVIDLFSRYAWAKALKSKRPEEIIEAFKVIFRERKPLKIQSDKGGEFVNSKFKTFLSNQGVKFYTTNNPDIKASLVERFNRTLKTKMYKYFTKYATYKYVDVLPKLMSSYNNSVHSSIDIAPSKVNSKNAFAIASRRLTKNVKSKQKFNIGDHVSISKERLPFAKGYTPNYTEEIFQVTNVDRNRPIPTYELKDLNGEDIKGSFYAEELVKVNVSPDTEYRIEKILRRRGSGPNLEYFIKWDGYPSSFNSWISAAAVRKI